MSPRARLLLVVAAFLPVLLALATSSDIRQVNRVAFVTAMGIEEGEEEAAVKVHLLVAVPSRTPGLAPGGGGGGGGGGTGGGPTVLLTEEGASISEAVEKAKAKLEWELNLGHSKVIMFADSLAEKGLQHDLDFLMRWEEIQVISMLGVTPGSPRKVLEQKPLLTASSADHLVDIFTRSGSRSPQVMPIYLWRFYALSQEPGQDGYLPIIGTTEGGDAKLVPMGTALFHQWRMVGRINESETKTLALLMNQRLENLVGATLKGDRFTMILSEAHVDRRLTWQGESPQLRVSVRSGGILQERRSALPLTTEVILALDEAFSRSVKAETEVLLRKIAAMGSDPLGFGRMYYNATWGQADLAWFAERYRKATVEVTANLEVKHRGVLGE